MQVFQATVDNCDVRRIRPEDSAHLDAFRHRLPPGICPELESRPPGEVLDGDRAGRILSFVAVLPAGRVVGYAAFEPGEEGRAVRPVFDSEQHSLGLEIRLREAVEFEAAGRGVEPRWVASRADSRARLRFVLICASLGPGFVAMGVGMAALGRQVPLPGKIDFLMWLFVGLGAAGGVLLPAITLTRVLPVLLRGERRTTIGLAVVAWGVTAGLVGLFWALRQ